MSLQEEREILWHINKLNKKKREVEAFAEYDKRIQSTKVRKRKGLLPYCCYT
jgi:hypothetical protein